MLSDIRDTLWGPMTIDVRLGRIYRPRYVRELSSDKSLIDWLARANRNIGLAAR